MSFQDHFSKQADIYLKARPRYPDELFDFLATLTPSGQLCWDCATGNGQAAISLAKHFEKVIGTDGSKQQIGKAITAENIEYRIATAEESGLNNHSADLITVATAAHWLDHDRFYAEAQRVGKRNAVLAIWTYSEAHIEPAIDETMEWFAYELLYDYWPDGRWYVRNKYENLPFPFKPIETPLFQCKMVWTKQQWLNYLMSWSSYNNYVSKQHSNPIDLLLPKLNLLWNDKEEKEVTWDLHLKCAKLNYTP